MEKKYWIGRKRSSMTMARKAATSEARLIHYELAGRHRFKAAQCPPSILADSQAMAGTQRPVLHLPDPAQRGSAGMSPPHPEPECRRDPDPTMREDR